MPTLLDHSLVSGDTATPLLGQVVAAAGLPRNITGWSLRYTAAYSEARDADLVLDKGTATGGVEILDAPTGTFKVVFDAADTATLGGRTFPHELEGTDVAGYVETVAVGALQVERDYAA